MATPEQRKKWVARHPVLATYWLTATTEKLSIASFVAATYLWHSDIFWVALLAAASLGHTTIKLAHLTTIMRQAVDIKVKEWGYGQS